MLDIGEEWVCTEEQKEQRLDKFLCEMIPEATRSQIHHWLEQDCFTLNGKEPKKSWHMQVGDRIEVQAIPHIEVDTCEAEDIPLNILHEEETFLVLNKPAGLIVHPGQGNMRGTIANGLMHYFSSIASVGNPLRPGILHRLDRDTSGLLLVAKTPESHRILSLSLSERKFSKTYIAWCWRPVAENEGEINLPLGRDTSNRVKRAVRNDGKSALTKYRVLCNLSCGSFLELDLITGRTHQIRVHLSYQNHPIVADPLYGGLDFSFSRLPPAARVDAVKLRDIFTTQALHAHRLSFPHPVTGEMVSFEAPLPENFAKANQVFGIEM